MPEKGKPFLLNPFESTVNPSISQGWSYTPKEMAIHGVKEHRAIDFAVPECTAVYAPISGWAIATFGEVLRKNPDGSIRQYNGKKVYYGSGLMIQIYNDTYGYCQLMHLEEINTVIPFYEPLIKNYQIITASELRALPQSFGKNITAYKLKAGELVGFVGRTGLGWGSPTYKKWSMELPYNSWDIFHLHLTLFKNRNEQTGDPENHYDPFGLYKTAPSYPATQKGWKKLPDSLWK